MLRCRKYTVEHDIGTLIHNLRRQSSSSDLHLYSECHLKNCNFWTLKHDWLSYVHSNQNLIKNNSNSYVSTGLRYHVLDQTVFFLKCNPRWPKKKEWIAHGKALVSTNHQSREQPTVILHHTNFWLNKIFLVDDSWKNWRIFIYYTVHVHNLLVNNFQITYLITINIAKLQTSYYSLFLLR